MTSLPLLPAMGVGSYASPGWFVAMRRSLRDKLKAVVAGTRLVRGEL